ncbi:Gfo/Idh/MocA family protein [Actinomycetota bacterium]
MKPVPPSSRIIRVGIVGAGDNTRRRHLPHLEDIADVEVVAVCNRTRDSAEQVARDWGIATVHDDWQALVESDDLDAVVIGTWPNMHRAVTLGALQAGKHVLCEARMAMDAQEAYDMLAAARARPDLVTQLVPSPLSFGVDKTIGRLIANGYLGTPLSLDVEVRSGTFPDPASSLHWRDDVERSGRNVMSLGIWYETVMRWIGEATSVTAAGKVIVRSRMDSSGVATPIRIPDHLDVIADMECGAQAHFHFSNVSGIITSSRATLFGADGVLQLDGGSLLGGRRGDTALRPIDIPADEVGHWRVEEEFIGAIRGEEEVTLTDFLTGMKYMEFTEAVWMSLGHGRRITLPLDGFKRT